MRLWSIHPSYLDSKGLVAVWREALLAKAVLENKTKGYKSHSQLLRFQCLENPVAYLNQYLMSIHEEACHRNYNFDISKIGTLDTLPKLTVTTKQLAFEMNHLKQKLITRDTTGKFLQQINTVQDPKSHPLFQIIPGEIEYYERVK